ncbi:MAG: Ppx/GppA family phosphatase [Actinomycetota bacterium]|nr:Ppx/GppA family phosphatase [Actinomycetota bacterium]
MTNPGSRPSSEGRGEPGAVGVIDCGTNSTRLLVVDAQGETLTRRMEITRLGQGVAASGRLAPEAVQRTIAVLLGYRRLMDDLGVGRVRITATSAARDADNSEDFFGAAEAAIGRLPELLTGDEEGQLSFTGATADLDAHLGPFLVADIGGGSTELAAGPSHEPGAGRFSLAGVRSLDVGCVRLTETYLRSDPPKPDQVEAARAAVNALVAGALEDIPALERPATFIGLAGTVSALTRLHQKLEVYDRDRVHHAWLGRNAVDHLLATLAAETVEQRRRRAGMEIERADVIVGGAIVVSELMALVGAERCLVSESDILDGLAMSLLELPPAP